MQSSRDGRLLAVHAQQFGRAPRLVHHEDIVGAHASDDPKRGAGEDGDGPLLQDHIDDNEHDGEGDDDLQDGGERKGDAVEVDDHVSQYEDHRDDEQDHVVQDPLLQLQRAQLVVGGEEIRIEADVGIVAGVQDGSEAKARGPHFHARPHIHIQKYGGLEVARSRPHG